MMDGRFDQHFAELFATSVDDNGKTDLSSLWPMAMACICGLAGFVFSAVLA